MDRRESDEVRRDGATAGCWFTACGTASVRPRTIVAVSTSISAGFTSVRSAYTRHCHEAKDGGTPPRRGSSSIF